MAVKPMTGPRVLEDLTAVERDRVAKVGELRQPLLLAYLSRRHEDGITPYCVADYMGWTWADTLPVLELAEEAQVIGLRRDLDARIRYLWRFGSMPQLYPHEQRMLRILRLELWDGPGQIHRFALAQRVGTNCLSIMRGLAHFEATGLLLRERSPDGDLFDLTALGRGEEVVDAG